VYIVEFTLRSPTCIAQRPTAPGQPTESLRYLTGTVVRGALAALFLRGRSYARDLSGQEREQFRRLFVSEAISFGNAWPRWPGEDWAATSVVPRTAWTHKRKGGWRGDDPASGGVVDALAALLTDDGAAALTDRGLDRLDHEFACEGRDGQWRRVEVRRRLISRTALARSEATLPPTSRGVVVDGQLYSFEAIEAGQQFHAVLRGDAGLLAELYNRDRFPQRGVAGVGQGRSRGMGQVEVRLRDVSLPDPLDRDPRELADHARAFTERAGASPEAVVYLPVTLLADTVLRDDYLLPCASGDPHVTLARYTNQPPPPELALRYAVQSTRWLGGWDAIRSIPRPPQLAVQQGSVWVYAIPPRLLDGAIAWLRAIEMGGVGERRGEGFGRVCLLHPFHATEATR
jgi:CRISPR-associated Csx10 family RAMP protein